MATKSQGRGTYGAPTKRTEQRGFKTHTKGPKKDQVVSSRVAQKERTKKRRMGKDEGSGEKEKGKNKWLNCLGHSRNRRKKR